MPDSLDIAGMHLQLNGIGLRTYSFLRIRIYVAGLYLVQPTSDPQAILTSQSPEALRFVFLRDVDAEHARNSWRDSFERNCGPDCRVPAESISRFLARVPAFHRGDTSTLLFTAEGVEISINDQVTGRIADHDFATLILVAFIGPHPASDKLKQALLGVR